MEEPEIRSSPSRNWANLPSDLLYCVLKKLTLLPDYIRFGVVCKSWSLVMLEQNQHRKESIQQEPPLLLIPVADNLEQRALYSVCEGKTYDYRFSVPYMRRTCGSSYGWWAIAEKKCEGKEVEITLFNPFSGSTIHLPCILKNLEDPEYNKARAEFLVHKVILSCDPSLYPDDYVVAAIYDFSFKFAWFRSGENSWILGCKLVRAVSDILFHKGLLYLVTFLSTRNYLAATDYQLSEDEYEYEVEDDKTQTLKNDTTYTWLVASDNYCTVQHKSYLVESSNGNLLLIRRILYWDGVRDHDYDAGNTIGFRVYKLKLDEMNPENGEGEWIEIQKLENDDVVFLGSNHSMCIPASHFPNCKSNSIYFTYDYADNRPDKYESNLREAKDMGIFDLENGSTENHFTLDDSLTYMAPPATWISPVLN